MMRLEDGRVLARCPRERRIMAHALFARGQRIDLLAFRVADTHIHALVACPRSEAGRFARYTASSIRRLLDLPVSFQAHFRPVLDQGHLYNAFRYVLRQEERHEIGLDPTHDGSSLLDLLGLRVIAPWHIQCVRTLLPRIQSVELLDILGVDLQMAPADLEHLGESAAAAVGASDLAHRGPLATAARVAATRVARASGLSHRRTACLLGLDERSVRRLETRPVDAAITRAIVLQLRLRSALRGLNRPAGPHNFTLDQLRAERR